MEELAYPSPVEELYVPDTSVLVEGAVSRLVKDGRIAGRVIIHRAVLAELEHQANQGKAVGFAGLDEVRRLRSLAEQGLVEISVEGEPPRQADVRLARLGSIDALIREYAWERGAVLVTGDRVQALVGEAMGLRVLYIPPKAAGKLRIEEYFAGDVMSVHLKEDTPPIVKKGRPGKWRFTALSEQPLSRSDVEEMAREIVEEARRRRDSFIEIDREGSTIVQLGMYRIVITRPPLSEGWEITAVRPLVHLSLEDYDLPPKLLRRFEEKAEGILIAGAPGMGKTTFAQALAEFYAAKGRVVKTIESPRDMRLPSVVTQYSKNYASPDELHDILLLSRPDYTVFDELRNDADFKLYVDLRLAGIGMIGVIHATTPIDAVQRFIGRVELGMIPSIVDTVIYIKDGKVDTVYELAMTVKLPTGLREAELARPVVEVRDFLSGELAYEIYTFGEQTVVIPVRRPRRGVEAKLQREVERLLPGARIEFEAGRATIYVPKELARTLSKRIRRIRKLGDKYGVEIRVVVENA